MDTTIIDIFEYIIDEVLEIPFEITDEDADAIDALVIEGY